MACAAAFRAKIPAAGRHRHGQKDQHCQTSRLERCVEQQKNHQQNNRRDQNQSLAGGLQVLKIAAPANFISRWESVHFQRSLLRLRNKRRHVASTHVGRDVKYGGDWIHVPLTAGSLFDPNVGQFISAEPALPPASATGSCFSRSIQSASPPESDTMNRKPRTAFENDAGPGDHPALPQHP
jgi:hypothetical protein